MTIFQVIREFAEGFARGMGIYLTDRHDPADVRYTGIYVTAKNRS